MDTFMPRDRALITDAGREDAYGRRSFTVRVPIAMGRGRKCAFRLTREVSMEGSSEWRALAVPSFSNLVPQFDEIESLEWRMVTEPSWVSGFNGRSAVFSGDAYYSHGYETIEMGALDFHRDGNEWACRVDRPVAGASYLLRRKMYRAALIERDHP